VKRKAAAGSFSSSERVAAFRISLGDLHDGFDEQQVGGTTAAARDVARRGVVGGRLKEDLVEGRILRKSRQVASRGGVVGRGGLEKVRGGHGDREEVRSDRVVEEGRKRGGGGEDEKTMGLYDSKVEEGRRWELRGGGGNCGVIVSGEEVEGKREGRGEEEGAMDLRRRGGDGDVAV